MTDKNNISRFTLLEKTLETRAGFNEETAQEVTLRILNYFGYHDEIIDNILNQEDRRLFYYLQDMNLLQTHWEETQLASGRNWRIFYWALNLDQLKECEIKLIQKVDDQDVYMSLPETAWNKEHFPAQT
jgi:hypothetical protein